MFRHLFKNAKWLGWIGVIVAAGTWIVTAQPAGDPLLRGFQDPPDSAKPRVWWHWMNGNISREGIKADLEWMKRAGIGGFQNFDGNLMVPRFLEKPLIYMTPEWKDAFQYTTALADRLGLEMAIAGSPGWSESGGPWVTPAQAMKKYVWSETRVEGGRPFSGALSKPPSATGPLQNLAGAGDLSSLLGQKSAPPPEYYADAAVVAFRAPADDLPATEPQPKVTSSGGSISLALLEDGDLVKTQALPAAPAGEKAWIQFEFARPRSIQAITLSTGKAGSPLAGLMGGAQPVPELEAGDDGRQFKPVAAITGGAAQRTVAFPPVTARYFRVTFQFTSADYSISELVLHAGARVNHFEEKAAFATAPTLYSFPTTGVASRDAVAKADVIDLTTRMHADGTLDWTPPAGHWVVLRMGYSLTGHRNGPASPEATGLEVDKLNKGYVKTYFDIYLDKYKDATGGLMGQRGLQYMVTDSWEAGVANWTDDMIAEFGKRRGYDMRPWLPALTGRVVESAEASDRFLWDFRRTLSDLVAEYHYDQLTALLKQRCMARYSESHESGRALIADGMEVKRSAAIPMSAMWVPTRGRNTAGYDADIRESASVAHIYGQNLVAAESFTICSSDGFAFAPERLKPTADRELAMGLNRFVIHTSVHQPSNDKIPGVSLGPCGQMFTRHETWAEQARPWTAYLSRSSYMLQQGRFVADIAYYYGEDSNITALFGDNPPPIPAGYNFDYINADALKNRLSAINGLLTTAGGMSYRVLALDPNSRHMSLAVLRKIRDLVSAGAAVVGPKPIDSPSQADDQAEFRKIADQLWGPGTGKGKVYGSGSIAEALTAMKVAPDFEYAKPQPDSSLMFIHRKLADGDLYWVSNANARAETLHATFRVQGKAPEIWHADTGVIEPASYRIADGRTAVPLRLGPNDALFVVFRKAAAAPSRTLSTPTEITLSTVSGGWDVAFQPERGAPAKITLDQLTSWSESADAGVKYFSGTGAYTKTVQAPADWFKSGARLWLDLGGVKNLAEVTVNGKALGIVWRTPFRVDATGALTPGANTLEIKVTNLWVNRLIGDQQPAATKKYTFTTSRFYSAGSPLLPSGLIGPVQIVRVE